jgi:hypothetical protein
MKCCVLDTPGSVFTRLYFLRYLQLEPISSNVSPLQTFPAYFNINTLAYWVTRKFLKKMKCCELDTSGSVFTTLYFLRYLQLGPTSSNVSPLQTFPAYFNINTLAYWVYSYIFEENGVLSIGHFWCCIHNTLFLSLLTIGSNKLKGFSLSNLSSLFQY